MRLVPAGRRVFFTIVLLAQLWIIAVLLVGALITGVIYGATLLAAQARGSLPAHRRALSRPALGRLHRQRPAAAIRSVDAQA